jgi:serine/threonine protein kinase
MSEPRPGPNSSAEPPAAIPLAEAAADLFAGPNGANTDDAPTIISKAPPQPARPEQTPAGTLRGRTLSHFELIEPIGVGGMAAVIRARDMQLDRFVALKILPPDMAGDPENVRRFHQEARAAARLDHENIARVFFCGEDQRLHFIAFEFVEGENLRVLLERRGRLPVPEAIHYMLQVATGLAHAAARGVVHRDIKPSNIIISSNGRAKLVDMGLARSLEPHRDNGLTQSGVTLGTFDYISPEQALEPRDADVRSDIYSLGCTLYHMLTGQPPVPDGTAAKKLHHHQHIAPVDPRQLNPQIPDDVAAIMARMMAKDPKDRYQRAEHLVQHLIMTAQKLGAVAETPDGVLFVDAPLPSAPRKRPAMIAALAVLALTALIAVLSLAPTDSGRTTAADAAPAVKDSVPRDSDTAKKPAPGPMTHPQGDRRIIVNTVAQLADALSGPQRVKHIRLAKDLTLTPGDNGMAAGEIVSLVYRGGRGQQLTIESLDPQNPCTIRVELPERTEETASWTGLTFEGGEVTLRNLQLEVKGGSAIMAESGLVALAVTRGQVTLDRCAFTQLDYASSAPAKSEQAVAMIAVGGSPSNPPRLLLKGCYFVKGQNPVLINSPAIVEAENCAFGPQAALFRLQGTTVNKRKTHIALHRCSALVVDGPVFRLDGEAGCQISVQDSIFSRPAGAFGGSDSGLIRQEHSSDFSKIQYAGKRNCYHNLNAFWTPSADAKEPPLFQWPEFRNALVKTQGKDVNSVALDASTSPWQNPDPLTEGKPQLAFRLKDNMPELRQEGGYDMIGIAQCLGVPVYPKLERLRPEKPLVRSPSAENVKIVDPDQLTNARQKIYQTLGAAILDARADDEIQIRSSKPLKISPIAPSRAISALTIKPFPGSQPILTLEDDNPEKRAAFFRLHESHLRFVDLEFQLKPNRAELDFQTVVEMVGNGKCTFERCVLTLFEGDRGDKTEKTVDMRRSAVRLTDPGEAMKMPAPALPRSVPEIRFQDCFVRGQGDLVAVLPSRPFDLDLVSSVVVLDGCLLSVDGTAKTPPAASTATDYTQVVKLTNLTTYLSGPLLLLRAKEDGSGLVPTAVRKASSNLFVAAGDKPLVQLDGLDKPQMERLFRWEDSTHNAYLNFETMLRYPKSTYEASAWPEFTGENNPEPAFSRLTGAKLDTILSQLTPDDLRKMKVDDAKIELKKYGADFEKLPRALSEMKEQAEVKESEE